jgi:3-hydroxybutyryl-CoA dehydrogenase
MPADRHWPVGHASPDGVADRNRRVNVPANDSAAVVVIGAGTMGAGIAQTFLQSGATVAVVEADAAAAQRGQQRIIDGLRMAYKRSDQPDAAVDADARRLRVLAGPPDLRPDLVIEAVPEDADLKASVLGQASRQWPDSIIATNTSSLSVGALADAIDRPGRFIGMHFFNPVPRSALVELVTSDAIDDPTVTMAEEWVERLGKHSIVVRDSPGFATSRLGLIIGLEAIRMVEEGVAAAADIDRGMVLGYRFPIGPLELTDLVGLDVRLSIADYLAGRLGPRFDPPRLLRDKVAAGDLGKKSGRGFYDWSTG